MNKIKSNINSIFKEEKINGDFLFAEMIIYENN